MEREGKGMSEARRGKGGWVERERERESEERREKREKRRERRERGRERREREREGGREGRKQRQRQKRLRDGPALRVDSVQSSGEEDGGGGTAE